jgi:hypothetical protein
MTQNRETNYYYMKKLYIKSIVYTIASRVVKIEHVILVTICCMRWSWEHSAKNIISKQYTKIISIELIFHLIKIRVFRE